MYTPPTFFFWSIQSKVLASPAQARLPAERPVGAGSSLIIEEGAAFRHAGEEFRIDRAMG